MLCFKYKANINKLENERKQKINFEVIKVLYCDLCNYYAEAKGKTKCICELTGFAFHKEPHEYDMENYPCFDYQINKGDTSVEILEQPLAARVLEKKLA